MKQIKLDSLAVFGLSFHGRQLVRKYIARNEKIDAIVDNDHLKSNGHFCGIPILTLEDGLAKGIRNFLLVGRYAGQQEEQLLRSGVNPNSIHHVPRSEVAIDGADLIERDDLTSSFMKQFHKSLSILDVISG